MAMCRACLATELNLKLMDESFLEDFNLLTGLNITLLEMSYSCKSCADAVKFCIEFRKKCIESDWSLQEICIADFKKEDNDMTVLKKELKFEPLQQDEESHDYSNSNISNPVYSETIDTNKQVTSRRKWSTRHKIFDPDLDYGPKTKTDGSKKRKISDLVHKNKKAKLTDSAFNEETDKSTSKEKACFNQLSCGLCSKSLDDKDALIQHLEHHKAGRTCGLCPETFINLPHMLGHRMDHLPKEQKGCHICSKKKIKSAISLEYHLMTDHEMAQKGEKIKCKQCERMYVDAAKLRKHIKDSHSALKYKCDYCSKGFRCKSDMALHISMHSARKSHKCEFCEFTSKSNTAMTTHKLRKHSENRIDCKLCSTVFRTEKGKEHHVCRAGLVVVCNICGKSFKKFALRVHMHTHSATPLYKCQKCPATFRGSNSLRMHMDQHAGTPRNRCQYCPAVFYSPSSLIRHRRIHTGEKPYVCQICNRGFTGNSNLKTHMKVHGLNIVQKKTPQENKTLPIAE